MADCTISSTGFVNYFPSKERTDREVANVFNKHGEDVVIINGEDNWNACKCFHVSTLLNKFKINIVDSFHNGISGITKSGAVIKKSDLETFIKKFNRCKWNIRRNNGYGEMCLNESLKIFDPSVNEWQSFFEIQYGDIEWINEKDPVTEKYSCRRKATLKVNNFKSTKKDISVHFKSFSTQWYWKKVASFV